jgi:hypothetical protein
MQIPSNTFQGSAAADLMVQSGHKMHLRKCLLLLLLLSRMPHLLQIPSDTFQGSAAADLMVNSGHRNIGLVYEDTPYGYGLGFSLIAAFTSREC